MRVLVLGAGGPAGVNTCRALKAAGYEVFASDDVPEHLEWCESYASTDEELDVDVAMPQPDSITLEIARKVRDRHELPATFLPRPQTILLCQDKFECGLAWRRAGLREDPITLIDCETSLAHALMEHPLPFWMRARNGAGAKAAIRVRNWYEASGWYRFWHARDPELEFVIEDALPGRDFSWCGLFRNGGLLADLGRERLEYIYPNLTPEGLTGTPTRARIVNDRRVEVMARLAVRAVTEKPHGIFSVDLKEDASGKVRPTEINAGRFSTTIGLWSLYQEQSNFIALAADLAMDDLARLDSWEDLPPGLVLSRHIDCGHHFSEAKVAA